MEALALDALRGLALLDRLGLLPDQARPYRHVPGDLCLKCGAPICAAIWALHRYCPPVHVIDPAAPRVFRPSRRRRRIPVDTRRAA